MRESSITRNWPSTPFRKKFIWWPTVLCNGETVWLKSVWVRNVYFPFGGEHYVSAPIYYTEGQAIMRKLQGEG